MAKRKEKSAVAAEEVVAEEATVVEEAVEGGAELAPTPEELDGALAEIEADELKAEVYAEQPPEAEATGKAAPSPASGKTKGKASTGGSSATPRIRMDDDTPASEVIKERLGPEGYKMFRLNNSSSLDEADLKGVMSVTLDRIDGLDKKSREKAINTFTRLSKGLTPSVYIVQGLEFLQRVKTATNAEVVQSFRDRGYQPGTARRQAGQIMALFPVLGIATRDSTRGAPIVFDEGSVIAGRINEAVDATRASAS